MGYSLYYMITSRCNLNCGYCFRDSSKKSLDSELSIEEIKQTITKLYNDYNVRKITISGGEPTFLKDNECKNFIELIDFLKSFKHKDSNDNLRIILITNAILLNEQVISQMVGVVDRITITIDALDEEILRKIGRSNEINGSYLNRTFNKMHILTKLGFEIKLHSVVSPINYDSLIDLAKYINTRTDINIVKWKFFQYMGFGNAKVDKVYSIDDDKYLALKEKIVSSLSLKNIEISFKSIKNQEATLFNLLPNGKFEYFVSQDGKKVRNQSKILFNYNNWDELFDDCNINIKNFKKIHCNEVELCQKKEYY